MPVDPHLLLAYLAACAVLILTPGPDMLFVIAQTLRGGSARGWAAALGIFAGALGHVGLAALGLAALLAASPGLFFAARVVGAAYLIWLGVSALRAALRPGGEAAPLPAVGTQQGLGAAFRQGMATNLLNPKVALFFLAFLPQFVAPDRAPAWLQMLLLVLLCHQVLACACCSCRQQGQRGRTRTRPTARRRRMVAIECGTCRSGRTGGAARPEASG